MKPKVVGFETTERFRKGLEILQMYQGKTHLSETLRVAIRGYVECEYHEKRNMLSTQQFSYELMTKQDDKGELSDNERRMLFMLGKDIENQVKQVKQLETIIEYLS